ncbi:MAG: ISNCY family transposase [Clostridia bacterium]|nr:ISNCY family transposase [Clostridia bacterium]
MSERRIALSQTELNRVLLLQRVLEGQLSVREAATIMGVSERHAWRLKARFLALGPEGLAHRNRGRKPLHAIPEELRLKVIELAQTKYKGCNYTFLSELLCEHEGICLSPSSVRRILKSCGIPSPRKHRPPKPHRSRPRKPQLGMLVQIDGSPHDWLEGRGPNITLLAALDDATGQILAALFRLTEDFEGYRQLLFEMVTTHGIPLAVYSDRHTLFFPPKARQNQPSLEQQLLGHNQPLTQIGRILNELGIQHIPARSPQAKGRIERLFETLQQRLVVELRLAGACTLEQANQVLKNGFIERFNRRFAVPAAICHSAFRPVPSHLRLEHIFCWKEHRRLNSGYTMHYAGMTLQVLNPPGNPIIPLRSIVEVHKLSDGRLFAAYNGYIYPLKPLEPNPLSKPTKPANTPKPDLPAAASSSRKPGPDHPWRKPYKPLRPVPKPDTLTFSLTSYT